MAQWLRLSTSTVGGVGSIPFGGTKIPDTVQYSQKKKLIREQIITGHVT